MEAEPAKMRGFQRLGFDVILDSTLKPFLLDIFIPIYLSEPGWLVGWLPYFSRHDA